ncbi:MAG TPA: PASTA domain-containing protein [Gaiellaceae bacterium]|nr:PASTA domain-containing protein [Gaiellaceae bacterium]
MNWTRRREADTLVDERPAVVEEEELAPPPPPPPPPRPLLWPWLLVLLVLVLGGLAAAWWLTHDDDHGTSPSTITGSSVRARAEVPNTIGKPRDAAVSAVRDAGLKPEAFTVSSSQKKGTVVAQHPDPGLRVAAGSTVRLNVSNGAGPGAAPPPPPPPPPAPPARVSVPDIAGQQQDVAQRELNAAGLKAGVVYLKSDEARGAVISQAPAGGTTLARGTRIQLNASFGPRPGALKGVPDVRNLDPAAARAKLAAAGFNVQTLHQPVSDRSQVGKVVDEQPRGRNAPSRSVVTIYVGRLV